MDLAESFAIGTRTRDQAEGRVYGFLYGVVTDNKDPQKIGRVRARIGAQQDGESSDWLEPMWPGAIEGTAAVKDSIVVCFIDGDPHRGMFAVAPKTTTQGRPTEAMILGTTMIGLYNDLVAKFNALQSDFQTAMMTFNSHAHPVPALGLLDGTSLPVTGSATSAPPTSSGPSNSGQAAGKGKASDGSTPSAIASDSTVLSGRAKVG